MLLCSSLTFMTLTCLPFPPFRTHARNFIPSLLFLDPFLVGKAIAHDSEWMDGSYWSLFVEVRFYAIAALIYFSARRRFLELCFAVATLSALLSYAAAWQWPRLRNLVDLVLFPEYLPWFMIGIGFYHLYVNRRGAFVHVVILESLAVLVVRVFIGLSQTGPPQSSAGVHLLVYLSIVAAFYALIYTPRWLSALSWRPLTTLGAASYSLYLLHQYIGVALLGYLTEVTGEAAEMVAVVVIAALIAVSVLIYRYWEMPARHLMLRLLRRRDTAVGPAAQPERFGAL
jgi:peptidoglycan/LPS O-acetylase OafA/YrhL